MSARAADFRQRFREMWHSASSRRQALAFTAEYCAVRLWMFLICCFPVNANLVTARLMGRIWWLAIRRHRDRAMDNLRPALGHRYDEAELRRIARASFEWAAQVFLVELAMTRRLVNIWSWARYIELGPIGPALRELLAERPVIMLTPHFGNFELLGSTIARLGLPLTALMRPLDNPLLNDLLLTQRTVEGLTLLYKKGAMAAAPKVLDDAGTLCFIADQDAGRKGIFADFFGRPASWYKSIGLLAMQYRAPIIVGAAVRTKPGRFQYRIECERIIQPEEWETQDDPLQWVTDTFAAALESMISRHPEQYLWVHRRWKTQPGARARHAASGGERRASAPPPIER